ncbi:uncharacterized protein LOC142226299 [Haematobia irritans]|uniref:uncharacterized protein LOC142226299 n=1 Tax=Haematobia irritans TaxID=7368 RepID=UPI003F50ACA5
MSTAGRKLNLKLEYGKAKHEKRKQEEQLAQWGAKKFDPTAKIMEAKSNPFRAPTTMKKFDHGKAGKRMFENRKFDKNRRFDNRKQFKPHTPRDLKPENATPWNKFKDEINHKLREDEHAAKQADWNTEEAKKVLKQREQNYRKMLMEQKRNEKTSWEDFGEDNEKKDYTKKLSSQNKKKRKHLKSEESQLDETLNDTTKGKQQKLSKCNTSVVEDNEKKDDGKQSSSQNKKKRKHLKSEESQPDETTKRKQQKESKSKTLLVDQETMKDFDPSKLDFSQKDKIRQLLTKATKIRKGSVVDTLKHFKNKQKKKNASTE